MPAPAPTERTSPATQAGGGLATVRIKNSCREKVLATVTYTPGSAEEQTQQVSVDARSSKALMAYVRSASGTYERRYGRNGTLRSYPQGGEIVLEACG